MAVTVLPANYIWLDLFPARITVPADPWAGFQPAHEEYRVIVTDAHFYILDDTLEGPQAIVTEPLTDFSGSHKEGYTVITEAGTYRVERALNCGCGSRLRGIYPFAGVPLQAQSIRK